MNESIKFDSQPAFENSSLIVGWNSDSGRLSPSVIDYLNKKLADKPFCEIRPAGFFPLSGVSVQDNVAQFPQSRFYYSRQKNIVLFKADEPQFERYQFLNTVLDVAEHYCKAKELYTVNGAVSLAAHTGERKILTVVNQPEIQKELHGPVRNGLRRYELKDMTWQGPPAISSYLLWLAAKRGLPGVSLWTEIPFYLAGWKDGQAVKTTLSFLNKRLNLEVDLGDLDNQNSRQDNLLTQLRQEDPDINRCVGALESGLSLSEEEQMQLVRGVNDFLRRNN
jgi:proteasome assembly chaperone (PAC2) family protein